MSNRYLLAPIQEVWRPTHPGERCRVNTGEHSRADWACSKLTATIALSAVQRRIYDFIGHYQRLWGETPLYREIRDACGLKSDSSVQYQIRKLVKIGLMRKPQRRVRAIILIAVPVSPG
jgi:hypothetical protein